MLRNILKEDSTPFIYGRFAIGDQFTDREDERSMLARNFYHRINTMLISPRRWGKSSLVRAVGTDMNKADKKYRFAHVDLFSVRTEEEFYETYAREIIKCTSTKLDDWIIHAKLFLKSISPKISIGLNPRDFQLQFDAGDLKKRYDEILNLPERICKSKKIRIIVCIDEFQNVSNFAEPLAFQKRLRSFWQTHNLATYCLYGSRRSMLTQMFEKTNMPFYKFGDVVYLQKIKPEAWQPFIAKAFSKTKKKITKEQIGVIVNAMQCHPYYVQQLCSIVWLNTKTSVNEQVLHAGIHSIIDQNSNIFEREIEAMSTTKVNILKALASDVHDKLSGAENLARFKLGTSANVIKALRAMDQDELIVKQNGLYYFIDPVFELWFRRRFLNHEITIASATER